MDGAGSRRKGAKGERDVVKWLRANGYPKARRYLSGDGRQPGDIDLGMPGLVIEVKNREAWAIPAWLRQAESESEDRRRGLPVVWAKLRGETDPGEWVVILRARDFFSDLRARDFFSDPWPPGPES